MMQNRLSEATVHPEESLLSKFYGGRRGSPIGATLSQIRPLLQSKKVAVLLMIVFRDVILGLIATLPNLIPVIIVGATLGFLEIPLDSITITLMPMVLGIAVDDTIHLMSWLVKHRLDGLDAADVLREAIEVVGNSLLTTTIILIVIFSIYFTSDILVLKHLGLLVIVGLVSALVTP